MICFVPIARIAVTIFALIGGSLEAASAQNARTVAPVAEPHAAPKPANIDRNGTLILIRSALMTLDDANKTGNYTVLRDIGSPAFQANSAARLSEIFAKQRNDNLDLSGVLVLDPQLTVLPQIEANGYLHMAGFFPSVPLQVNFEMLFAPVAGKWRLFGLSINVGSSTPVAPEIPLPAASPTSKPSTAPPANSAVPKSPTAPIATSKPPK